MKLKIKWIELCYESYLFSSEVLLGSGKAGRRFQYFSLLLQIEISICISRYNFCNIESWFLVNK